MVMVLHLGVCSGFLTNNFVDTDADVLICCLNVTLLLSQRVLCVQDPWRVLVLWGRQICDGWLCDGW